MVTVTVADNTSGSVTVVVLPFPSKSITHAVCAASLICTSYVVAGAKPVNAPDDCHVEPPSILYSYVPYPPNGLVILISPLSAPLHVTLVTVTVADNALVGPSTVTLVSAVHPLASFTVKVYVPTTTGLNGRLFSVIKFAPSMLYSYGVVPPVVLERLIPPIPSPKQVTGLVTISFKLNANTSGCPTTVPFDPSKSMTQLEFTASRIET